MACAELFGEWEIWGLGDEENQDKCTLFNIQITLHIMQFSYPKNLRKSA